ncbi:MAG: dipicolinate synthase subunit B [Oscillospiraceae bacterium]|nr:dipicolinate synthase subunit B [Oscillospiraceae bacterium]
MNDQCPLLGGQMESIRIGVGMTGSFCTFGAIFEALEDLKHRGAEMTFVLSYHTQRLESRFGKPQNTLERIRELSCAEPILTVPDAEPLGPKSLIDVFFIAPCTGNTLAKLAMGITDTAVFRINTPNPKTFILFPQDFLAFTLTGLDRL